jgi:hypothetical protein
MTRRRPSPYLACLTVLVGLMTVPTAGAASGGHHERAGFATVGHLAYVSTNNRVVRVKVKTAGQTSKPRRLGPVTQPPTHRIVQIESFVASGDGNWLAWLEVVAKANGTPTRQQPVLVVRDLEQHQLYRLQTTSVPVGFAGDTLVVDGTRASRLVLQPSPHLVPLPGQEYPTATYPEGIVDVKYTSAPAGPDHTDRLRLTRFDGTHTVLHNYLLGPSDTRIPDLAFASGDGTKLVVERGDHTDFGGIGPSSVVDEFALNDGHQRTRLGHYGTAQKAWRIGGVSFARSTDAVWAVWERATRNGATSVVAAHHRSGWKSVVPHGIAVAGNPDGYVVVQPGKYEFASDGLQVSRVPTGGALLLHDSTVKVLDIKGSQFAWVR